MKLGCSERLLSDADFSRRYVRRGPWVEMARSTQRVKGDRATQPDVQTRCLQWCRVDTNAITLGARRSQPNGRTPISQPCSQSANTIHATTPTTTVTTLRDALPGA